MNGARNDAAPRLLLVDDLQDSLDLLRAVIEHHFANVAILTALNGPDGIKIAREQPIDLILCDAVMPGMDGFEMCRRLKAEPATATIPVLMVSGVLVETEDRISGLESGADGYVCKPFETDELIAQIRALLRIKRNEDELRRHRKELEQELVRRTEHLRQSEQRFRLLFEHSPDAIFVEDAEGRVLDANPAGCRLHGMSREEIVGKYVYDLAPAGEREKIKKEFPRQFSGEMREFEGVSATRDGRAVPVEIRTNRTVFQGKEALILHVRDITEKKKADERQKTTTAGLRAVVEIAEELVRCVDLDAVYLRTVELAREKLGLERCGILLEDRGYIQGTFGTDINGRTTDERAHRFPMDERWRARLKPRGPNEARWIITEDAFHTWNARAMEATDRKGWVAITPIQSEYRIIGLFCNDAALTGRPWDPATQEVVSVLCSLLGNIIERKRVESERMRLATAVEQAAELVVITDPLGIIQYVNPAFERTTGFSRDDVIGQTPRLLKSGKQDTAFYKNMWDTLLRGEVWTGRLTNRKKNGSLYEAEQTISPLLDAKRQIVGFLSVSQDVTRAVQMEAELRQSQKMESIGRLAGGIAHDFNNLLTAILGFARLIQDGLGADHALRSDADEIIRAGERAAKLTKQLLAFGRKQITQIQPVDLNAIVANMDQILRRTLGEDIELVVLLTEGDSRVEADIGLIEQVLMNLAVNSRDAMPRGGKLTIATDLVMLDDSYAQSHIGVKPGSYVLLSVRDTGIGMTPDVLEHAFEPFFTTKEKGKGSGLGLSTVYGIVSQCRGHIEISSEPNAGTEVKIHFPRTSAPVHRLGGDEVNVLPRGTETILLVEDEGAVRRLTQRNLASLGYKIMAAGNGEEALRLFEQTKDGIDLVVTDVVMPRMGGPELVERLRALKKRIKVLYMSGFAEDMTMDRIHVKHAAAVILKPFTLDTLARTVRQVLDEP